MCCKFYDTDGVSADTPSPSPPPTPDLSACALLSLLRFKSVRRIQKDLMQKTDPDPNLTFKHEQNLNHTNLVSSFSLYFKHLEGLFHRKFVNPFI